MTKMSLVVNNTVVEASDKLQMLVDSVRLAFEDARIAGRTVASNLLTIKTEHAEELEKLGFKNVVEFSAVMFNIKKAQTYKLIQVAEKFDEPVFANHYNVSQLYEMLPYDVDTLDTLHRDGLINETMSVKTLREHLKDLLNIEASEEASEAVEAEEASEEASEAVEAEEEEHGLYTDLVKLLTDYAGKGNTDAFVKAFITLASEYGFEYNLD